MILEPQTALMMTNVQPLRNPRHHPEKNPSRRKPLTTPSPPFRRRLNARNPSQPKLKPKPLEKKPSDFLIIWYHKLLCSKLRINDGRLTARATRLPGP